MDRARATIAVTVILAAAGLAGNALRATEPGRRGSLGLAVAPYSPIGASYVEEPLDPRFLEVLRAEEVVFRTYESDSDTPVWLFLAYFDEQKEGSQAHSPKHCYPGSGWNILREVAWPAPWGRGDMHSLVVGDGEAQRLVSYWFQTPWEIVPDVLPLKIALAKHALRRRPQEVVFVSLSTPAGHDLAADQQRLVPYARTIQSQLERLYATRHEAVSHPD